MVQTVILVQKIQIKMPTLQKEAVKNSKTPQSNFVRAFKRSRKIGSESKILAMSRFYLEVIKIIFLSSEKIIKFVFKFKVEFLIQYEFVLTNFLGNFKW